MKRPERSGVWEQLPEFEELGELGRGGSSIVYLARDRALGREVAIKVIQSEVGDDREAVARFAQEARLLAGLRHPNIVSAYSVKQLAGGGLALVLEYVAGRTLRQVLGTEGALPVDRAIAILRDVADALDAAHRHGVVHRDVKPENIFLEESSGRAMLADFGIAMKLDSPSGLTLAGTALGTPNYMSPEQIDGRRTDGRSDLYSLALIGWEMLTGQRPWQGENLFGVIFKQKREDLPSLRKLRGDVPVGVAHAIEGALAKDPNARWGSVAEFREQLAAESLADRWQHWSTARLWKRRASARLAAAGTRLEAGAQETVKTVFFRRGEPEEAAVTGSAGWPERPAVGAGRVGAGAGAGPIAGGATRQRRWGLAGGALLAALVIIGVIGIREPLAAPERQDGAGIDLPAGAEAFATGLGETTGPRAGAARLAGEGEAAGEPSAAVVLPAGDGPADAESAAGEAVEGGDVVADGAESEGSSDLPASPGGGMPELAETVAEPLLPLPSGGPRIAAGGMHTCEIDARGTLFCWGGNDRGQVGGTPGPRAAQAVAVEAPIGFRLVAAGSFHTCGLDTDGVAICWGENGDGQLGAGPGQPGAPVRVPQRRFLSLALGSAHTCSIDQSGRGFCWGSNARGQLGDGSRSSRAAPVAVRLGDPLAGIAAGWTHSCALTREGRLFCWGSNDRGQLGDGSTTDRLSPVAIPAETRFRAVTAGSAHTCALSTDGETYCWGENDDGRLGDGTTLGRARPTRVRTTQRFVEISAGGRHTCGLTANGTAFCWGQNNYGQLGTGSTEQQTLPARVQSDVRFTAVRSSGSHTCALTAGGASYCWGYNIEGQLGDGTQSHRTLPQRVERVSPGTG